MQRTKHINTAKRGDHPAAARRKPAPIPESVSVQSGGLTYWADYIVEDGLVTTYCEQGSLTAHLCGSQPVVLARRLLCQIIDNPAEA